MTQLIIGSSIQALLWGLFFELLILNTGNEFNGYKVIVEGTDVPSIPLKVLLQTIRLGLRGGMLILIQALKKHFFYAIPFA